MADQLSEKASRALRLLEDGCQQQHDSFCLKLQRGYRAYRAILDARQAAAARADWLPPATPPFVQHIVESTLAGLVDAEVKFRVRPRGRFWDPGEFQRALQGAKAHEILHDCQLAEDYFAEKQWPFALQDAIGGLTVMKNFWRRDRVTRPRLEMVVDETGLPRLVEQERTELAYDGPCSEVVNVEDFFWHEAAVELQKSPVIGHRVWMHFSDLKANEKNDSRPFGYQNVDQLKDARDRGEEYSAQRITDGTSRSKDMIEVLEIHWIEDSGEKWMVTLGNRRVELKPARKNPFWHGEYPFVACSTRPDLFAIPGVSQVEKIAALQDAHWDLDHQTRKNVHLANNHIVAFQLDMIPDVDALVHEPGARWPVEGDVDQAIKPIPIDTNVTTLALPHLSRLEAQMQQLAGSQPFTSTGEARQINADTATEAALITNLAQRATLRLKQQLNYAYGRIGQQRTELNQQFIRLPKLVQKLGLDNEMEQVPIIPYLLQGDYLFDIAPMNESLMRSERKAEASAALQVLQPWVAIQLQLAQAGAATPINTDALLEYVIENLIGDGDPERFFSSKQAPPPALPAGGQQQAAPPGQPNYGTTAPQSIDPATSPSANASMSGEMMMQRALAMRGGPANT